MMDGDPIWDFLRKHVADEFRRYDNADEYTSVGRLDGQIARARLEAFRVTAQAAGFDVQALWDIAKRDAGEVSE